MIGAGIYKFATKVLMDAYTPLIVNNAAAHAYVLAENATYEWNGTIWVKMTQSPVVIASADNSITVTPSGVDNQIFDVVTEAGLLPLTSDVTVGATTITTNIQDVLNALATDSHVAATFTDSTKIDFTVSGTDNQTITATVLEAGLDASLIPIVDVAGNYTATNIEDAFAEIFTALHTPAITVDGNTIDFTASGTDNQTFTAEITGSSTALVGTVPTSDGAGNITWSLPLVLPEYDSNELAIVGGVAIGEFYQLSVDNIYGLPHGLHITAV